MYPLLGDFDAYHSVVGSDVSFFSPNKGDSSIVTKFIRYNFVLFFPIPTSYIRQSLSGHHTGRAWPKNSVCVIFLIFEPSEFITKTPDPGTRFDMNAIFSPSDDQLGSPSLYSPDVS